MKTRASRPSKNGAVQGESNGNESATRGRRNLHREPTLRNGFRQAEARSEEAAKLKAGQFIEIKYCDAPNGIALVLEKPSDPKGHIGTFRLRLLTQGVDARGVVSDKSYYTTFVESDQVVAILKANLIWPN